MTGTSDPRLTQRLNLYGSIAAMSSVAIGLAALIGWTLHIPILLTWGGPQSIAPNCAASVMLGGVSQWILRKKGDEPSPAGKLTARTLAVFTGVVCLLTLVEHITGVDFGIDRLLLFAPPFARTLMSPVSAASSVLLSFALLQIDWRTERGGWPAQYFCYGALMGAAFGFLSVALGPSVSRATLSLPAAVCYFALASGLLCSRADWAMGGLLTSPSQGARLLRRAVPVALVVLGAIGFSIAKPLLTGARITWVQVSAVAVFSSAFLAGFIAWMAFIVERSEAERRKVEAAFHVTQEQLDRLLDRVVEPQSEVRLRRGARLIFTVAVFLTALLGFLSWHTARQAGDYADWVAHAHEVSISLEAVLRHSLDVETGGRGFAETGSAPFLEPYESGKPAVSRDLAELRQLLVDPRQTQRLKTLEGQSKTQVEIVSGIVDARRREERMPAPAQFERGKQAMDAIRITVNEMEGAASRLLGERTQRVRSTRDLSGSLIACGSLLGVIFLSIAGVIVGREIGVSARARAQVKALNADLERRVMERTAALQESETNFRSVLACMSEGLVTTDEKGKFIIWNPAAERILGLGPVNMSSEEWSAHYGLFMPDTVTPFPPERNPLLLALQGEVSSSADIFVRNSALGTGIWIESSAGPIRDQDGVLRGGVAAFRDITQRKTDELEIRKLNDELEQRVLERTAQFESANRQLHDANGLLTEAKADAEAANRAKSTFLSTMSHEIRTPLNAVLGYAQLMLRDPTLGADAKANLKIIGRSGEHLLALIGDILDMSKIEAGRTELNPATFYVLGLFEDLAAMFRLRAEAKALRFEMSVDGVSVPYAVADEGKIRQVLINLLGNAVKFTQRGGIKLRVTLEQRPADRLWMSARVEDSGPGIVDAEQRKLFEPFSQASYGLNTQGGTGLGLAIGRKFARLMGGDITISSELGHGSTFRFDIPIERAQAGAASGTSPLRRVVAIRTGQEAKILVVDDHLENRDWLTKLLADVGFSVQSANDGQAAIQNWEEWRPGLILMDMHMPVMDGLEATRRIKENPRGKETVIIALTASALEGDRKDVVRSGADDFLAKPCREDELLEKIRVLLNVTYDYEEINQTDSQPAEGILALGAALEQLPRQLLEELLSATLKGSKGSLDKCILRVRETENSESARALQQLADKYEYDVLTRLLEEACRHPTSHLDSADVSSV